MTLAAASVSPEERARLENCVREPIRRPGTVQPHGVLLTAVRGGGDHAAWTIEQASSNAASLLRRSTDQLHDTGLADLIGEAPVAQLDAVLTGALSASNPVAVRIDGRDFDAIAHETDGVILVELEPALDARQFASTASVYEAVGRLREATSMHDLWRLTATQLHALTGFDRVSVYRFHADGHGEIVAEERSDDAMEPYLGLHFPSSDVPAQARQLYLTKLSRTIFSTEENSHPLLPEVVGEPLDLSGAELRSVSPHHLKFMRNMGQASTLSFSLVVGDELVGMITCAHRTPRRLPFALRQSLEVFATEVAVHLKAKGEVSRLERRADLLALRGRLIEQLARSGDLAAALLHDRVTLLHLVPATAAAVCLDGVTSSIGDIPAVLDLAGIVEHVRASGNDLPLATDALESEHPLIAEQLPGIAGLLVVPFDDGNAFFAWLRPEITQSIAWLGDQSETNRDSSLSPRNSFSAWSRSVSGQAQAWAGAVDEAAEFGRDLDSALLRNREASLAHLGLHDALTGLPNRRQLMERLEPALTEQLVGTGLALLFIDIDAFKSINDSHGHDLGDAVLIQVATRLRDVIRESDSVTRLGGDEFVLLCTGTDRAAALGVAERVLAALRSRIVVGDRVLAMTVSIGVALATPMDSAADLLQRADAAMYRAKRAGGNRVAD